MNAGLPPADWPHRNCSRLVESQGKRWHVQHMGSGKRLLLIHGTGASCHSWAGLMSELRENCELLAVDLPGHGFSELADGDGMSLPGMARRVSGLLQTLDYAPDVVVGHSAGAAILARMCLDDLVAPESLVSINGALLALPGLTGAFFSTSARMLAAIPAVPSWVSSLGGRRAFTRRLIHGTGSILPGPDVECYRYPVGSPDHVAAALKMMAAWDLVSLEADLPRLRLPVYLLACEEDRTVPCDHARSVRDLLPGATVITLPGLGHLGHEEDPARFARTLRELAGLTGESG